MHQDNSVDCARTSTALLHLFKYIVRVSMHNALEYIYLQETGQQRVQKVLPVTVV
jgi:hypothetical protein